MPGQVYLRENWLVYVSACENKSVLLQVSVYIPKQAMFPSSPIYLRSHLAACISVGSLSVMSSMAKTAF